MESCRNDTIGAFNAYVEKLAKDQPEATLSLTLFDSGGIDTVYTNTPIQLVKGLNRDTFVPRGMTPLFDAIGKCIAELDGSKNKLKSLVILTDGAENCSREYNASSIKALITDRQENKSWLVQYLGANQDAFAVGSTFGMTFENTMSYSTDNIGQTMNASFASSSRYAKSGGNLRAAAFTDEERAKSK